jgi:hypothetical protein
MNLIKLVLSIIFCYLTINILGIDEVLAQEEHTDSCLVLLENHFQDQDISNPDSVLIDTCLCSDIHWTECEYLYAKQWFEILFPIGSINLPYYPADTIIYINWDDIDSSFTEIREKLLNMYTAFGQYSMQKVYPDIIDPSRSGSRYFLIKFDDYCNIDSVEEYLIGISDVKAKYIRRFVQDIESYMNEYSAIFDNSSFEVIPNPASEKITLSITLPELSNLNISIFDILGNRMYKNNEYRIIGEYSNEMDITGFQPGIYFVRVEAGSGIYVKKLVVY